MLPIKISMDFINGKTNVHTLLSVGGGFCSACLLSLTVVGDGLDVEDGLLSESAGEETERFAVMLY